MPKSDKNFVKFKNLRRTHIRAFALFLFVQGKTAAAAHRQLRRVLGVYSNKERTVQKWFARFADGNYSLEDMPRSGRPMLLSDDEVERIVLPDRSITLEEMANELGCSESTVRRELYKLGFTHRMGVYIPFALNKEQLLNRVKLCKKNMELAKKARFFRKLVTCDEKQVYYYNEGSRLQWLLPNEPGQGVVKPGRFVKKALLSVWWGMDGVYHWELLPHGENITIKLYGEILRRVDTALREEWGKKGKILLLHDGASSHRAKATRATLKELKWEPIEHPSHSPDLSPCDYYLFRSLSNDMRGVSLKNVDEVRDYLENYFTAKPKEFWKHGILSLYDRWDTVARHGGKYVDEIELKR